MEHQTVNVADLKLDGANPRHDPAKAQRDIISALFNVAARHSSARELSFASSVTPFASARPILMPLSGRIGPL
ncbi:MAG: hypothetical protein ABSG37_12015 [Candidatus Limnocylindrales bacterium]